MFCIGIIILLNYYDMI